MEQRKEIAVKAAQAIPRKTVTSENIVEIVQNIIDILGSSMIGKENSDYVWLCGIKLTSANIIETKIADLQKQIDSLKEMDNG